jgi:hypothetical protein
LIADSRPDDLRRILALSNTNRTNWLLAAAPDLYLFGALAEAHGFVKDAESLALWKARRDELLDEIERLDVKTRGPSGIRVIGPTP